VGIEAASFVVFDGCFLAEGRIICWVGDFGSAKSILTLFRSADNVVTPGEEWAWAAKTKPSKLPGP